MTAVFALLGALIVGASDVGGGMAARRASVFRVTAWIQAGSGLLLLSAVWFVDAPNVFGRDVAAGMVAGVSGVFSFVALYSAFARGQISRLAPTAAIVGAIIPTLVSVGRGEALTAVQVAGLAVACLAILLVTQERADPGHSVSTPPEAFALALAAGLGFSVFFLALGETQEGAGLWPLVIARATSVPIVVVIALVASGGVMLPADARKLAMLAGLSEGVSNVFVLWAYQRGPTAVAAALGAFYPVSSVMLARVLLDERLQRVQWIGVALALASVPLIAV